MYNKSKVPNRNEAARILLKDIKGKLIYNHYPPNLNSRHKFLFYNGKNIISNNDENDVDNDNFVDNVLDQNKLNINDCDNEQEEDEEEEDEEEKKKKKNNKISQI